MLSWGLTGTFHFHVLMRFGSGDASKPVAMDERPIATGFFVPETTLYISRAKKLYDKMVTNLTDRDLDYIVRIVENGLSRAHAEKAQARLPLSEQTNCCREAGTLEGEEAGNG